MSKTLRIAFVALIAFAAINASAQQPPGGSSGTRGGVPGQASPGIPGQVAPAGGSPAAQRPGAQQAAPAVPSLPIPAGAGRFVAAAALGERSMTISVAGRLEPSRRIAHSLSVGGFVEAVHVRVGDRVREGQALITVTRDAPGDSFRPVVLTARLAGRVSEVTLSAGAEARAGAAVVTVVDDSSLIMRVSLSDRDAHRVAALAGPELTARSADGARLSGRVNAVNTEPDYATGLFQATLRFSAQAAARVGLVVFMDLPVASLRGVFIRRELVVRRFGRTLIWTVDAGDSLRLVPVVLGRAFGEEFVVSSGLNPGTRYLTRLSGKEAEGMALRELMAAVGGS